MTFDPLAVLVKPFMHIMTRNPALEPCFTEPCFSISFGSTLPAQSFTVNLL